MGAYFRGPLKKCWALNRIFTVINKELKLTMHTARGRSFYGVPQGSTLGPLLFNIHLCDIFYVLEELDIASYTDDTTIYTVNEKKYESK